MNPIMSGRVEKRKTPRRGGRSSSAGGARRKSITHGMQKASDSKSVAVGDEEDEDEEDKDEEDKEPLDPLSNCFSKKSLRLGNKSTEAERIFRAACGIKEKHSYEHYFRMLILFAENHPELDVDNFVQLLQKECPQGIGNNEWANDWTITDRDLQQLLRDHNAGSKTKTSKTRTIATRALNRSKLNVKGVCMTTDLEQLGGILAEYIAKMKTSQSLLKFPISVVLLDRWHEMIKLHWYRSGANILVFCNALREAEKESSILPIYANYLCNNPEAKALFINLHQWSIADCRAEFIEFIKIKANASGRRHIMIQRCHAHKLPRYLLKYAVHFISEWACKRCKIKAKSRSLRDIAKTAKMADQDEWEEFRKHIDLYVSNSEAYRILGTFGVEDDEWNTFKETIKSLDQTSPEYAASIVDLIIKYFLHGKISLTKYDYNSCEAHITSIQKIDSEATSYENFVDLLESSPKYNSYFNLLARHLYLEDIYRHTSHEQVDARSLATLLCWEYKVEPQPNDPFIATQVHTIKIRFMLYKTKLENAIKLASQRLMKTNPTLSITDPDYGTNLKRAMESLFWRQSPFPGTEFSFYDDDKRLKVYVAIAKYCMERDNIKNNLKKTATYSLAKAESARKGREALRVHGNSSLLDRAF